MTWDQVDPALASTLMGKVDTFSSLPTALTNLMAALRDPEATPAHVARIASTDPAFVTEVLSTLNSAYFGMRVKVNDIGRAIVMLGYSRVNVMAMRRAMDRSLGSLNDPEYQKKLTDLWRHSFLVSEVVSLLAKQHTRLGFEATTAALLHDLGKLLLLDVQAKNEFDAEVVFNADAVSMEERILLEEDYYGVNHCLIGRQIADTLELPDLIGEVVSYHHHRLDDPALSELPRHTVQVVALVKLADCVVHDHIAGLDADAGLAPASQRPQPEMPLYWKHCRQLPPYDQLTSEVRPVLKKALEFIDSMVPASQLSVSDEPTGQTVPAANEEIPRTVANRYLLLQLLGEGTLGSVYLCEDQLLGQKFAMKLLRSDIADSAKGLESFRHEARIAMRLNHPNIVRIFHFDVRDGLCYTLQEYVNGRSLDQIVRSRGKLSEREFVPIAVSVARAMAYSHGKSVVHRDLSAGNVLVNEQGVAKLVDFGIATCKAAAGGAEHDVVPAVAGTPYYMSPEHWEGVEHLDASSDVYSFGVLAYRALSGEFPFQAPDNDALRRSQRTERPPDIADVSRQMQSLIRRCLRPIKSERWQDFDSLVAELDPSRELVPT